MKNSLADLNNHLFEMIERLNDDELTEEQLELEQKRIGAVVDISKTILEAGRLQFEVLKMQTDYNHNVDKENMPELLMIDKRT